MRRHDPGVEQHPDGDEEERREDVAERRHVGGRLRPEPRLADDEPGEERAERDRHGEDLGREERDAERDDEHRQREELGRAGASDAFHRRRDEAAAHQPDERGEDRCLAEREAERTRDAGRVAALRRERRQHHQREHREQVLDDQPADRDVAVARAEAVLRDQHAHQHHGARHGERHAEHHAGGVRPAERVREAPARDGRHRALRDRAGDGDAPDAQQLLRMEVQPDAEHQQDHADLGHLRGERGVGDEARRVRSDDDAGEHVADERRQPEPLRDPAEDERDGKPAGESDDDREVVHAARKRHR